MLDSLHVYLQTSTTPELRAAITEAYELFDEYGLDDISTGYEDILMTANNEGESEAMMRIVALTENLQDHILTQMQIVVVDELRVSEGNTILRALKDVQNTEMNDEIVGICRENSDPVEALAEILNLVTGIEPERLVTMFQEVSPRTIQAIQAMAGQHVGENRATLDVEQDTKVIDRFMVYREAMDNQPLFMYDMIMASVPLNQPYAIYHGKIMEAIAHEESVQPMAPRLRQVKTAVQLCGAIIVACDTQDANMRNIVHAELEKTYSDVDTITPIYVEIDSIMTKFHNLLNTTPRETSSEAS